MIIYNTDKSVTKLEIQPDGSSRQTIGIQEDDVLSLSFTHFRCVPIDVNYCVEFDGKDYRALERFMPEQVSDTKWKYDIKLYGPTSRIKRFVVTQEGSPVFSLTGPPDDHLDLVIGSINRGLGYDWLSIGEVEPTEFVNIDYKGTYANEALAMLSEKTGAEWWIKDGKLNLSKCSYGNEISLEYGKELISLERETNKNQNFFTRLYPIGSAKNIDVEEYGYERLQLPEIEGERPTFVDSDDIERYGIIEHCEEEIFEDIYPIFIGEIVAMDYKNLVVENLLFNVGDYIEPGKNLKISFLTGNLRGIEQNEEGFEVNGEWAQEHGRATIDVKYGDITIRPKIGDTFIFKNIGIPPIIVKIAEGRLLAKAKWFINELKKDTNTYRATTNYLSFKDDRLDIGMKVKLISDKFFHDTEGEFSSRITRISRNVNIPELVEIEMSEVLTSSVFQSLTKKVDMIYESYVAQHVKKENPTELTLEWNAEMGEIPDYATKIILSADKDETIELPSKPFDNILIVIENQSDFTKTISGNGHTIYKNGYGDTDSVNIAKKSKMKFIFYDDSDHYGISPLLRNKWYQKNI